MSCKEPISLFQPSQGDKFLYAGSIIAQDDYKGWDWEAGDGYMFTNGIR